MGQKLKRLVEGEPREHTEGEQCQPIEWDAAGRKEQQQQRRPGPEFERGADAWSANPVCDPRTPSIRCLKK